MVAYHDDEWGTPVHDDIELFERLVLESLPGRPVVVDDPAQARRRSARRSTASIRGWSPPSVPTDRARLMADAGIVRNGAKIDATIGNAAPFLATAAEAGSFAAYLARDGAVTAGAAGPDDSAPARSRPRRRSRTRCRRTSAGAASASSGSTIVYAFMQSVGLVDDHLPGCFRYRGVTG